MDDQLYSTCSRKAPHLPDQDLTQRARALAIYKLFRIRQLYVHVGVDTNELTVVFSLAPFEAYDDRFVDAIGEETLILRFQICRKTISL